MKSITKLILFLLTCILFNCKNNNTITVDYKYDDKPKAISCEGLNSKLYMEALYSFEEDILNFYGKNNRNTNAQPTLTTAYATFIRTAVYSKVPYESVISEHTLNIFKALKDDNTLWDAENTKSHLNYSSPLIECISKNIKDNNLKTTFNALISTNSMSPKLFGSPLSSKYRNALSDKHLATYIAFDLFYSRLFDMDMQKINFDNSVQATDGN
ncbi:hypothetical protein [Seonamhaeicola sp. ML3]|uniref:hypothetical protein n=1 Tax=Seonamhaeicola sp. ML3 TaxID=2937786 RepID=UPI00200BB9A4|nr:hypothetical protein [Seonamhaeicola sp. ML3]